MKLFNSNIITSTKGDLKCTVALVPIGITSWNVKLVIKKNNISKSIEFNSGNDCKYISMIYTSVLNIVKRNIDGSKNIESIFPQFNSLPIYKSDNFLEFLLEGIKQGELINFSEFDLIKLRLQTN